MSEKNHSPPARPKKEAKNVESGKRLSFPVGGSRGGLVLLSKLWPSANVGVFIDIPVTGTPNGRMLIGRYGVYAIEKAVAKLYHSDDFGVFNPRMGKDGIENIEAHHNIISDGAPTVVRVQFSAKPHKVGGVAAAILAKCQFTPSASDMSKPFLAPFPRDLSVLYWAAQRFYESIKSAASICIIGGKKASVKDTIEEKFATKYSKKYSPPDLKGATAPKGEGVTMPDMFAFEFPVSPATATVMAHVMSGHGIVWVDGGKIGLTIEPDYMRYAKRVVSSILSNPNRASMTLSWYERQAKRDPVNGNSLPTVLAMAGVACGLPASFATQILSLSSVPVLSTAKAVASAAEKIHLTEKKTEKGKAKGKKAISDGEGKASGRDCEKKKAADDA